MIIRDAIYKDINIEDPLILSLIETPEFQRLRRIKQLGLTYTIFPSAEHTRYSHSIGVYYLAKKMVNIIEESRQIRYEKIEVEALLVASLLHDVGHGPFSHTAEECFDYSHEDYSILIIQDGRTKINKILRNYAPGFLEQVCQYIEKKHENYILNQILSATIDVDRMDYLIRDSHHAGVVYGNFDVNRLLKIIDVQNDELVFMEKGIQTLEDFILSRYHMFGQVYLNTKTIGNEQLVQGILNRIRKLHNDNYRFKVNIKKLLPFFENQIRVSDYLQMDDYVLTTILVEMSQRENDQVLKDLSTAFCNQTPLHMEKNPDKEYYEFVSKAYHKKIYNESVKIVHEDGSINNLEDVSQLIKFCKESLEITCSSKKYYLEKNES